MCKLNCSFCREAWVPEEKLNLIDSFEPIAIVAVCMNDKSEFLNKNRTEKDGVCRLFDDMRIDEIDVVKKNSKLFPGDIDIEKDKKVFYQGSMFQKYLTGKIGPMSSHSFIDKVD